jgi:hypothetical protein
MIHVETAIEDLLRARAGEALSKLQIASALDMPVSGGPLAREVMRELQHTLFRLAEDGRIRAALPCAQRPEFHFWIDAPQSAQPTLFEEARP